MEQIEQLDFLLLGPLEKHGPWLSRGELWRTAPIDQITRDQVAAWTDSAEERGLISRQERAGSTAVYALTEAGERALE